MSDVICSAFCDIAIDGTDFTLESHFLDTHLEKDDDNDRVLNRLWVAIQILHFHRLPYVSEVLRIFKSYLCCAKLYFALFANRIFSIRCLFCVNI